MNLSILNLKNYNKMPAQVNFTAQNPIQTTAPTQIEAQKTEPTISSAASKPLNGTIAADALKASSLAQAPMPYSFVGEIKLPFSKNAKYYKMANGQKVVVLEKKGPTILKSYFNVGSMNEPDSKRGISHFNEHMAFNGTTDGLEPGEFFKIINKMGAMTNASTGFAQTDYFISSQLLHEKDWDTSVSIHSKMLQSPAHKPKMIEKEKGPVTSEISMVGDRPENLAMNNCIKNLYQIQTTSPDLVAGCVANINNLTNKDTLDYHNLWYTPDNCTTVITGEIDEKTAMDSISKYFNKFKSVSTENRKHEELKAIEKPIRTDEKMAKAQASTIVMGFSGPQNSNAKENIMLELLMTSLLGHSYARMTSALIKKQSSASMCVERVGNRPQDPKAVLIVSEATSEKTETVIKTLYDEINNLSQKPLTKDELDVSKKNLKLMFSKVSENSHTLNSLIGNAILDNSLDHIQNYLPVLESITPEEISAFAKKYLDLNKVSLSVVHPGDLSDNEISSNYTKTNTQIAQNGQVQGIMQKSPSFKGRIDDKIFDHSKVKQYKLANNMEIMVNPNNSDLVCTQVTLETPFPADTKPTVPHILSAMLNDHVKSNKTLFGNFDKSGVDFSINANLDSITAETQSLTEDAGLSIDTLKKSINNIQFTPKSFEYAKCLIKEALLSSEVSASGLAFEKLFPKMPQFATLETALKSIDDVTLAEVNGLYQYIMQNSMAKAVVTAPIEKKPEIENNVIQKLSTDFKTFKPFEINKFKCYTPLAENQIITKAKPAKQADVTQAFKFKTSHNPKDEMTFHLMNMILGGSSSSRLFNDLREQQKLAYRVNSNLDFVGDTGVVSLEIKTTTDDKEANDIKYDNVEKSLNGFNHHIEKIKNEQVTDEELEGAKLRMKTILLSSTESSASQTDILSSSKEEIYGLESLKKNLRLIDEINAQDIQNAAKYIFSTPSVTSIIASEDTLKNSTIKPTF